MNDATGDDPDNKQGKGEDHDASRRMNGLSDEKRRLLDALMREHGMSGDAEKPKGEGSARERSAGEQTREPPPSGDGTVPPDPASSLVAVKAAGSLPPFFCVHAILGSAFPYHRLALHMEPEQPFYGFQSRGLDGAGKPLETIEEMAGLYIELMRGVQPRGPYRIGGYSFGGWVAFEMAQQLVRSGESVALLAVLGASAPIATSNPALFEQFKYAAQYADDYRDLVLNSFWSDAVREAASGGAPGPGSGAPIENRLDNPWGALLTPFQSPVTTVAAVNNQAQFRYVPRPYTGAIDLFITSEQQALTHPDPTMGWKQLSVEDVAIHPVAGNHLSMLQEPYVKELAERLNTLLRDSRSHH